MAKKLNNTALLFILLALGGAYLLITNFGGGSAETNIPTQLVSLDSAKVTDIVISPKQGNGSVITLSRTSGKWTVSQAGKTVKADQNGPSAMLAALTNVKPKSLAAVSKAKWEKYEVTDSLGTRVKAMNGSKVLTDIVMGKFSFQQQPQSMTSFVRLTGKDQVFSVDGPVAMGFNRPFDQFRDRSFLKINKANVTKISYEAGGVSKTVSKQGNTWIGSDSTSVDTYLNGLANLSGTGFKDGFQGGTPIGKVTVEGNNMPATVVSCYQDGNGFVLQSSQNPDTWFSSDSTATYQSVFGGLGGLFR